MRRIARRVLLPIAIAIGLGLAGCAVTTDRAPLPIERAFPPGFEPPPSAATGQPVRGWGGRWREPAGPERASPSRTPVIFVHGNTEDATYWEPARQWFRAHGWNDDELWAPSHGHGSTAHFDANDTTVPTLDAFVSEVLRYLSAQAGRPVRQVDIVAHSLGVTAVRQWLTQTNRWHEVRSLVAVAGANHGVWTARPDARGISRESSFELHRGSPWLAQLNAGGEVVGPTRVMTLFDGTGRYDTLFPGDYADSPALTGAVNVAWNRDAKGWLAGGLNHLALPRSSATLAVIAGFLGAGTEALPNATPPRIVRHGDTLRAEPAGARLHCAGEGLDPSPATPPARDTVTLPAGGDWIACYARSPVSGLASPLERHAARAAVAASGGPPSAAPPTLAADHAAGAYPHPVDIRLTSNRGDALIVYSTAGLAPDSGSARYRGAPIHVPTPVLLTAVAITPDGQRSETLRLRLEPSVHREDEMHPLQVQLDAPIQR